MKVEDVKKVKKKKPITNIALPSDEISAIDFDPSQENDNFWEITGYPSLGKLYASGTKIYGRPLKVLELKKLANLDEDNADALINEVLKKTIRGINVDDILVSDKLYFVFWLRANTFKDSGYSIDLNCTKCNKESSYDFSLNDVTIKKINKDFDPDKILTLPKSKVEISFKYQTIKSEKITNEFKSRMDFEPDEDVLAIAGFIDSVTDIDSDLLSKYNYLCDLDPSEYVYISTYIKQKLDMGVSPIMQVKCNKCGGVGPVPISFRGDFFLPSYNFG